MAGSLDDPKQDLLKRDGITFCKRGMRKYAVPCSGCVDRGSCPFGEIAKAGYEVGMQVGLEDMRDPDTELACRIKVHPDVSCGIDNRTAAVARNEIGTVRNTTDEKLPDNQLNSPRNSMLVLW